MASDDSASGESRQVRELAPELRETAREAARRRGISVDQWLRSAIVDSAKEGGGATSKEGGGAASAEPAAAQDLFSRRLDALSEQLDRLSRVGVSPSAAPAASAPDPELKDSLHAIERRLAALGQNVPPSAVATPSLVEVLARLNSRLDRIVGARPAGSPARNSDMAPEGEDVSDGLLTDDWDTDLDRAITEINTRQRALLGEIDVSAFEAALAEPDPEAVAAAARPPGAGITQLQQQFEKLTEELRILRVSGGFADRIETLRSEVAGIAATLQNAAPRVAIENLESQVRALVERVDRTRIAGGESETLTDVERALRDLRETIERMAPAELLAGLRDQASVLDRKIEQAGARGQDDGSTLPQLQKQVSELREIVGRAATGDGLVTLTQEVRSLAARLDRFDPRQAEEDLLARLDRKFDALTVGLAAGGGKSADDLVRLVDTLSRKIDALEINRNNLPALENIVDQVTRLSERIEASGTRLDQLGEIESSFARLLDRMDELHGQTIETAERVARETVSSRPGADADTLARALRRIDELNTTQRENERHTQDTLEAVHDTLERLVDRMAGLEGGGVRADVATPVKASASPRQTIDSPSIAPEPSEPRAAPRQSGAPAAERRPIDPDLPADFPLEPGLGRVRPGASAAERIAASEAAFGATGQTASADPKANFIAAARRAAQAAASMSAAAEKSKAENLKPSPLSVLTQKITGKRSLILAVAIFAGGITTHLALNGFTLPVDIPDVAVAPDTKSTKVAAAPAQPAAQPESAVAETSGPFAGAGAFASAPAADPQADLSANAPAAPMPSVSPLAIASMQGPTADITGSLGRATGLESKKAAPAAMGGKPEAVAPRLTDASAALPARLRSAAAAGDPTAEYEVATRFAEGRDVPVDLAEAARWFERAATRNLAPAQYRLGSMYEKGNGVKKDLDQARRLYRAAADGGNGKAMHNLAVLYAEGVEGKSDYAMAAHWFRKAAERGVADSQYNLAVLYARGLSVEQNLAESYKWFALAAKEGDADAAKKRDEVGGRLDPTTLAAARRWVDTFKPEPQPDSAVKVPAPAEGWEGGSASSPTPAPRPRSATTSRKTRS